MTFYSKHTANCYVLCNALFDYDNNTYLNFITDEYQIKIGMIRPTMFMELMYFSGCDFGLAIYT